MCIFTDRTMTIQLLHAFSLHDYIKFTACIFITYKVTTVTYILECNKIQKTCALLSWR